MAKTQSECTPGEAMRYLRSYFATVDIVSDALSKYETLASDALTATTRSFFRAKALEARRDLELLTNQRRAFINDEAAIKPPAESVVANLEEMATGIAKLLAKEAKANAIIKIATDGLNAFNKLNA
jgi:hypothetical protein